MRHDTVLKSSLPEGYLIIGFGEFLDIVYSMEQWVMICLCQTGLKHMKDDLGILGIILVPGVIQGCERK